MIRSAVRSSVRSAVYPAVHSAAVVSTPTPADLSTAPLLWLSAGATSLYKTDGSAAGNGETVETWVRPGDDPVDPTYNYAIQRSGGDQPEVVVDSGLYHLDGGSSDVMVLQTPLSLSGDFTAWFVGKRAVDTIWCPLGVSTFANDAIQIYSDNSVYIQGATTNVSVSFTGTNGSLIVARVRRASGTAFFASTGMAEANLGAFGETLALDQVLARAAFSTFTSAGNWLSDVVVIDAAATEGDDAIMANYLATRWGVAL